MAIALDGHNAIQLSGTTKVEIVPPGLPGRRGNDVHSIKMTNRDDQTRTFTITIRNGAIEDRVIVSDSIAAGGGWEYSPAVYGPIVVPEGGCVFLETDATANSTEPTAEADWTP